MSGPAGSHAQRKEIAMPSRSALGDPTRHFVGTIHRGIAVGCRAGWTPRPGSPARAGLSVSLALAFLLVLVPVAQAVSGTWSPVASMAFARESHTATLMRTG